jgi:phosphatidate cytidylyltransferase
MKNFWARLCTGVVYVALIGLGILWNIYSFLALFSLVIVLCLREFYGLVNAQKRVKIDLWYNCLGGFLLFLATFLYVSGHSGYSVFFIYLIYILVVLISELYKKHADPVNHAAYVFFGQCYIALPVSILNLIAFQGIVGESTAYNRLLVLSLFIFLWANDTGAYSIGVLFGKHRFFERISPKKSWEGFFGGLIFTFISAFAFAYFRPEIPWYHWVGLSLVVVLFGTWGDLFESLIKRTLEVKDSGHCLPGHGGWLDRFDSMLLAVYAMLLYVQAFIFK